MRYVEAQPARRYAIETEYRTGREHQAVGYCALCELVGAAAATQSRPDEEASRRLQRDVEIEAAQHRDHLRSLQRQLLAEALDLPAILSRREKFGHDAFVELGGDDSGQPLALDQRSSDLPVSCNETAAQIRRQSLGETRQINHAIQLIEVGDAEGR